MRRTFAVAFVVSFLSLFVVPARAATSVTVADYRFTPGTVAFPQGGSISWHYGASGYTHHTSTQNGPLRLWNTGFITPGMTSASVSLFAAGSYAYHCNVHPSMHGIVQVPIVVSPTHGTRMTNFTIQLASARQAGFTYDVQRKVGTGAWTTWKAGVTSTIVRFRRGPGTLWFRSRLHRTSGGASGWSLPRRITIGWRALRSVRRGSRASLPGSPS